MKIQEKLLTKQELADVLNVSTRTINRRMDEGLPHLAIGSVPRFNYSEVIEWLKNKSTSSDQSA